MAVVEPQPGVTLDIASVRAQLKTSLADYKVPKHVEIQAQSAAGGFRQDLQAPAARSLLGAGGAEDLEAPVFPHGEGAARLEPWWLRRGPCFERPLRAHRTSRTLDVAASIFILRCGKKLHTADCRAVSGVPAMSSQTMPSETEIRANRVEDAGRRPAADRYPAARAHPRRHRARPGRRRRVRPGRAHPADLDPVPPRRGQAGAARTRSDPRQHVDQPDRAHRPRLQLFLAPCQYRRGPEQHPADAGAAGARRGAAQGRWPRRWRMRATAGFSAADLRKFFDNGAGQSGPDRASDRSPPQEHHRPRDGDRGAAGPARAGPADAGGDRGQRRAVAPRGADAVEDQSVAPDQAHRARRGRQRPVVLRLHLPARSAAAALRAGGPAERRQERRAGRTGVVPARWEAGSAATATATRS